MEQTNSAGMITPQQSVQGLSFKGIFQVFTQPTAFFDQLKNDPKILIPYILLAIIFAVVAFLIGDLIVQMQLDSPQMEQQLQGQPVTEQMKQMMKVSSSIALVLGLLLAPLCAAALALLVGNFFMGLKAGFKQVLSVMLYANIIYGLGMLVLAPMMVAKGSMVISLSAAVLVASHGIESLPYVALGKIDLFIIWEIIIAGIGLAAVYNVPRNKGYVLSVLSVGALSILHIVWAAVT